MPHGDRVEFRFARKSCYRVLQKTLKWFARAAVARTVAKWLAVTESLAAHAPAHGMFVFPNQRQAPAGRRARVGKLIPLPNSWHGTVQYRVTFMLKECLTVGDYFHKTMSKPKHRQWPPHVG